jgi:uncharacterized DUF497 family protein
MTVEWDERKAASNRTKHGVSFEEAVTALMDPLAATWFDRIVGGEERNITVGQSARDRLLLVVYTERRGGRVRIISARRASPGERRAYEEGI